MTWDPATIFVAGFSVLFLGLGWWETFWWRHRSELVEVEAEVISIGAVGDGMESAEVRYTIDGFVFFRARVSRLDAIRFTRDTKRLLLYVLPGKPKRVTGNPKVSLWKGIFFLSVGSLAAAGQWQFQWLNFPA